MYPQNNVTGKRLREKSISLWLILTVGQIWLLFRKTRNNENDKLNFRFMLGTKETTYYMSQANVAIPCIADNVNSRDEGTTSN